MTTMHQLKITLQDVEPPVWRRLLVPSEYSLAQVHDALIIVMGWAGYHLYASRIGDVSYLDEDDDEPDDSVDPASVRFGDLVGAGDTFVFEYDFGDGWEHLVVVEGVLPAAGQLRPVCLEGRRACPPEDVGGPWGYKDFLTAIRDPSHEQHAELLEWVGDGFDAEAFDSVAVDDVLASTWPARP